jgi:eukaryotic-like serine/threonine-protein kinase
MIYQPGDIILDKYRIEALIGRGAFAEVCRATHLALDAPRALKILRKDAPGLGSSEYGDFHARFQLEAKLGARLDHPNIIRVHDFEQDGESLILVMEYAQGGSLSEKLAAARERDELIPIDEVVQIASDVAQGLSAIHALDAVHRDLKPSNILFDKRGRAKVADVGLAQVPGGPSMRSQLSTGVPHPGTPGYMSPEQESISNYLTPASDVYALGLVLFEMLTGRVYRSQRSGTRTKELRQDVPVWLDDLVARMLAVDVESRPWNGEEIAGLLLEGVLGEETQRKEEQAKRQAEEKARLEEQERARLAAEEQAHLEAHAKASPKPDPIIRGAERKIRKIFWQRLPIWAWVILGGGLALAAGLLVILGILPLLAGQSDSVPSKTANEILGAIATNTTMPTNTQAAPPTKTETKIPQPTDTATPVPPSPTPEGLAQDITQNGVSMILIPAGSFEMGADADEALSECQELYETFTDYTCERSWFDDEEPQHTVNLDGFYIDQYEVTNAQYEGCVDVGECDPPERSDSYTRDNYYGNSKYDDYPVINVSWLDADDYCAWRGARLPTEAEWEKAARGGLDGKLYPWGDTFDGDRVNFCDSNCELDWANPEYDDGYNDTASVGIYAPNGYGLYDMAGNVWEWVSNWYDVYPGGDPNASDYYGQEKRALRGGSWFNDGIFLRVASRGRYAPSNANFNLGFRCALSP